MRSGRYTLAFLAVIIVAGILCCVVFCCIPSRGPSDGDIVKAF